MIQIKKLILCLLLIMFVTINLFANNVPTNGEWKDGIVKRSLISTRPIIYANENIISIYLAEALTDLVVVITDQKGRVIYQENITTNQPYETFTIILPNKVTDTCIITLLHQYGYLIGWL